MTLVQMTRAQLKNACDQQNWDLLDHLLEIDNSLINDNALYTDDWGEWWGMLLECIYRNQPDGVRVLLKHGADKNLESWGDCAPTSPLTAAQDNPAILKLLQAQTLPDYTRQTEPPLPIQETAADRAINQQGQVRDQTGLVFSPKAFTVNDKK